MAANARKNWFWVDSEWSLRNTMPEILIKDENDSLVINTANAYIENQSIFLNRYVFRTDSITGRRMFDYWPIVVKIIVDFQSIIMSEYPEFEMAWQAKEDVLANAFLTSMGEGRIEEWEDILHLTYEEGDTLEMRRDAVIARIRGQGKLNTAAIEAIVSAFTGGGEVRSYVEDSTLHVWVTPPSGNRMYRFASIEAEIQKRIPAHLGLHVERTFQSWNDVKAKCETWQAEMDKYNTWNDTMYDIAN